MDGTTENRLVGNQAALGAAVLALGFAAIAAIPAPWPAGRDDATESVVAPRSGPRDAWTEADRLAALAGDLDPAERKARFIELVLPIVIEANEAILAERAVVEAFGRRLAAGIALAPPERAAFERIKRRYDVASDHVGVLLRRVDAIPVSLALAQAALESGWGTSRFAREANALFGERTWQAGVGLVPEARAETESFEVRAFRDLAASVRSYMANLNGGDTYRAFRAERARQRRAGAVLDGERLAGTMLAYAEQGAEYVERVRAIMRDNDLGAHDRLRQLFAVAGPAPDPRT
ncbi:MAG: glucosaminidase domain-containing protein [Alphaproteobacteria bacterium]